MRKIFVLTCLIVFCIICVLFFNKEEKTITVFNEQENSYDVYLLDLSQNNITTTNLTDYFDGTKILEIYPYINPLYKKVINFSSYTFNTAISNKKNISNFISEYKEQLKLNALTTESLKVNINGIKINKIKIYTSNNVINNLIDKYSINLIK